MLQVICTHLGLNAQERRRQTDALLGSGWLDAAESDGPVVLLGDLNASPRSAVCRALDARLRDAQRQVKDWQPRNTWFARRPTLRIDHIYVSPGILIETIDVPQTLDARLASDHLPLLAALRLPATETRNEDRAVHRAAMPV
jgi:endonuclease/exonuclease/phosphatase family metal-dependent hydrolase